MCLNIFSSSPEVAVFLLGKQWKLQTDARNARRQYLCLGVGQLHPKPAFAFCDCCVITSAVSRTSALLLLMLYTWAPSTSPWVECGLSLKFQPASQALFFLVTSAGAVVGGLLKCCCLTLVTARNSSLHRGMVGMETLICHIGTFNQSRRPSFIMIRNRINI